MKRSGRRIVQQIGLGLAGTGLPWLPLAAAARSEPAKVAASCPAKPITIVVPGPAGGATDVIARTMAQGARAWAGRAGPSCRAFRWAGAASGR